MLGDQRAAVAELGALAAAARTSVYALKLDDRCSRCRPIERSAPTTPFQDRIGARRGARDAGRRVARVAVQRHRYRQRACSRGSTSELSGYYLLGVESRAVGQGRQTASDSRRGRVAAARRCVRGVTLLALPADARPRNAARSDDRRAADAAAGFGAAASRRHVHAEGAGNRQGADADSRRRRDRLLGVARGRARLHDHRQQRAAWSTARARMRGCRR